MIRKNVINGFFATCVFFFMSSGCCFGQEVIARPDYNNFNTVLEHFEGMIQSCKALNGLEAIDQCLRHCANSTATREKERIQNKQVRVSPKRFEGEWRSCTNHYNRLYAQYGNAKTDFVEAVDHLKKDFDKNHIVSTDPDPHNIPEIKYHLKEAALACDKLPGKSYEKYDCIKVCSRLSEEIKQGSDPGLFFRKWSHCKDKQYLAYGIERIKKATLQGTEVHLHDFVWGRKGAEKYWYAGQIRSFEDGKISLILGDQKMKWFTHDEIKPIQAPVLAEVDAISNGQYYQADIDSLGTSANAHVAYTAEIPYNIERDSEECVVRNRHSLKWFNDNVSLLKLRTYDAIESDRKHRKSAMEDPCERIAMFSANCPPISLQLTGQEYGATQHFAQNLCFSRYLTTSEQVFLGAFSGVMLNKCGYPASVADSSKILTFIESTWIVSNAGGPVYGKKDMSEVLGKQTESYVALYAGVTLAEKLKCSQNSEQIVQGVVHYLDHTSMKKTGGMYFVDTCFSHYGGKYTKEQCQCVADLGRSVIPNIHSSRFQPEIIYEITKRNPFISGANVVQCGIINY